MGHIVDIDETSIKKKSKTALDAAVQIIGCSVEWIASPRSGLKSWFIRTGRNLPHVLRESRDCEVRTASESTLWLLAPRSGHFVEPTRPNPAFGLAFGSRLEMLLEAEE